MLAIGIANLAAGIVFNQAIGTFVGLAIIAMSGAVLMLSLGNRKQTEQSQNNVALKPFYDNQRRLEILSAKTPNDVPSKQLIKESLFLGKSIVEQAEELAVARRDLGKLLFEASEYRVKLQKLTERNASSEEIQHVKNQLDLFESAKEMAVELDRRINELSDQFETLVNQMVNGTTSDSLQSMENKDSELLLELRALSASAEEVKNWISSSSELNYERNQTSG